MNLKEKQFGYWLSVLLLLLCIAMAIIYTVSYMGSSEFSWPAFLILLINIAVGVILLLVDKIAWYPAISFVLVLLLLLFFALGMVNYVANAVIGIDSDGVDVKFIASVVVIGAILIVNWLSLCMKQKA